MGTTINLYFNYTVDLFIRSESFFFKYCPIAAHVRFHSILRASFAATSFITIEIQNVTGCVCLQQLRMDAVSRGELITNRNNSNMSGGKENEDAPIMTLVVDDAL